MNLIVFPEWTNYGVRNCLRGERVGCVVVRLWRDSGFRGSGIHLLQCNNCIIFADAVIQEVLWNLKLVLSAENHTHTLNTVKFFLNSRPSLYKWMNLKLTDWKIWSQLRGVIGQIHVHSFLYLRKPLYRIYYWTSSAKPVSLKALVYSPTQASISSYTVVCLCLTIWAQFMCYFGFHALSLSDSVFSGGWMLVLIYLKIYIYVLYIKNIFASFQQLLYSLPCNII